jgi:hypothetical protein
MRINISFSSYHISHINFFVTSFYQKKTNKKKKREVINIRLISMV